MKPASDIERQILGLPAVDRARLALKAWESLSDDPDAASDPAIDAKGIGSAIERDRELNSGAVSAIDDDVFRRRTGGGG